MSFVKCSECGKPTFAFSWVVKPKCAECNRKAHLMELQRNLQSGGETSTSCEDDIICPYCGEIYEIEDEYDLYSEGEHEIECPFCEKKFKVDTHVSITFDTERIEESEDQE